MQGRHGLIFVIAAAIVVAGIFLVACGGGGSTDSDAGPSKAAFVKRANAICDTTVQDRSDAMESTTKRLASAGQVSVATEREELVVKAIVPTEKRMVAELAKLDPPEADAETIEKIVTGLEQGIERIEGEPSIAFRPVVVTQADVLAEKYGLPECRV